MMNKIPAVLPSDFGHIEGEVADMGWILAENRFRDAFPGSYEYREPWDRVLKAHGCFRASNSVVWANGTNRIIEVLNSLPEQCSREKLQSAFGL